MAGDSLTSQWILERLVNKNLLLKRKRKRKQKETAVVDYVEGGVQLPLISKYVGEA